MVLPNRYQTGVARNLASYDFYDLATGTGYKTFYMVDVRGEGVDQVKYIMVTNPIGGCIGYFSQSIAYDLDFDLTFEKTTKIDGIIYFSIPYKLATNYEMKIDFYHVDSTPTETQIGATVERNGNAADDKIFSGFVDTGGVITFKKGEKLRLTFSTTTVQAANFIMCDPLGRTALGGVTPNTSQAIVNLPIIIQQ